MNKTFSGPLFCASSLLLVLAIPLEAQNSPEVSVAVGQMQYSESSTGAVPMIALRGAVPLVSSWLLGEANFTFASLREPSLIIGTQAGVAEGQLQVQLPLARVRPYLGVGAGWIHYFDNGLRRAETARTVSAAAGLRVGFSRRFGATTELRLRGWNYHSDPTGSHFGNFAADWTAGWMYTF